MRIAIVDDLAAERTLLKDRLEQQLHRRNVQADILEYESGETFLEAARKAPFTAAFLDIYMDGMTGTSSAFSNSVRPCSASSAETTPFS